MSRPMVRCRVPGWRRFRWSSTSRFGYPAADRSPSPRWRCGTLDNSRVGEVCTASASVPSRVRWSRWSARTAREVDDRVFAALYDVDAGAVRLSGVDVRDLISPPRETVACDQDGTCSTTRSAPTWRTRGGLSRRRDLGGAGAGAARRADALVPTADHRRSERGYRLSGGERQRLTIARLLLAQPRSWCWTRRRPPGLRVGAAVGEALIGALEGRTSLVIAHRLSTSARP